MGLFSFKTEQDKDLQERRRIMEPPSPEGFAYGFSWRTAGGAIFLGFLMMPATMYLTLVVGLQGSMQQAARWMTVILFAEIGRRSMKDLQLQEVYLLFFMSGLLLQAPNQFQGLLWNQFFARSDYTHAMGIAQDIPYWWAPTKDTIESAGRTFFTAAWVPSILVTTYALIITRLDNYTLGYVMYRITNDVERLPFPMAPVAAGGITALANAGDPKQHWRWRAFSIGGMVGFSFGLVYVGIPAVTGALLAQPLNLVPIPWVDLSPAVGQLLPAAPFNISFDLGLFFLGMVMPFWAVIGGVAGIIATIIACPLLYRAGILTTWVEGMDVVNVMYVNNVDFFLPFSLGLMVALAAVSASMAFRGALGAMFEKRQDRAGSPSTGKKLADGWRRFTQSNRARGDYSTYWGLILYAGISAMWIGFGEVMIPHFPTLIFIVISLVYIPLISYTSAKVEGLAGQGLTIPMVREASIILSGYQGVAIWFVPMPTFNYGTTAREFRVAELCGTKFRSLIVTALACLSIIVIAEIVFSQLMWFIGDVPSDIYPYAQEMWELQAKNQSLIFSSTQEGGSMFMRAWDMHHFGWGLGMGVGLFALLNILGLQTLLIIGFIRILGHGTPAMVVLELSGALVSRLYLRRKFGEQWNKYPPVLFAGFSAGMGLVGMLAIAFTMCKKLMEPFIY